MSKKQSSKVKYNNVYIISNLYQNKLQEKKIKLKGVQYYKDIQRHKRV
jgi:hypothetical protein